MAGIGFGPLLSAIGAGIGMGSEQIQQQRYNQQRLALQQLAERRQALMLEDYLRKQSEGEQLASLSLGGLGGGLTRGTEGGLPGSRFASPGAAEVAPIPGVRSPFASLPSAGIASRPSATMGAAGEYGVGQAGDPAALLTGRMTALGVPQAAAEGAVRYMDRNESGLNPRAVNPTSGALGVAQWLGPRKAALTGQYGQQPDIMQQADFLGQELESGADAGGTLPALRTAGSAKEGYDIWGRQFERPGQAALAKAGVGRGGETQVAQAGPPSMTDASPAGGMGAAPMPQMPSDQQIMGALQQRAPGAPPRVLWGAFQQVKKAALENYRMEMQQWQQNRITSQGEAQLQETRRGHAETERYHRGQEERAGREELVLPDGTQVVGVAGKPETFKTRTGKKLTPEQLEQLDKPGVTKFGTTVPFTLADEDAELLARQRMAGDIQALQGLGWGNVGAANRAKVISKMRELGATGEQVAAARAEFAATTAAAQTAGRRQAQIGMAINELKLFLPEAKRVSETVDRTQFPTLNSVLLSWQAGTGDENIRRLAVVTNEVVNAYAAVVTRGLGVPTDAARAQGHAILNNAFTKGQYNAALDEMMKMAETASGAAPATIKETTDRLRNLYAAPGAAPSSGGPAAQPAGAGARGAGPAVGAVENGYRFKGGDPGNPASWEKVQ